MKRLTCLLALAAAGCASATTTTPKSGSAMPASIVEPYLRIQTALANDSVDEVRANAGNVATVSAALGAPAMKIDMAAVQLASATAIEDAREKFGALSEALVAYMDGLHLTSPEGVRVAFCPMKNKPWLQQGAAINNPYFGASMQTCGSFRP